MKKLTAIFIAIVLCIMAVGCSDDVKAPETAGTDITVITTDLTDSDTKIITADTDTTEVTTAENTPITDENGSTPLLYKVTDKEGDVVWLFGSIHVGRDDYYPLPDYVTRAFSGSDVLAVEADIVAFENDISAQMAALQPMLYLDGTKISDVLSDELYSEAVDILKENGYYNAMLDLYKPSFWSSLVDTFLYTKIGADIDNGIDRHLLNLAKKSGKEIAEIESAAEQYEMMGTFSVEIQVSMLEESVENYKNFDTVKEELTTMMDLWASGDEETFEEYLRMDVETEGATAEEIALAEEFIKAMYTDRNQNMADFAEDALKSGDEVFICVGAAHVVGDDGMVGIMTERGYTVERVK